ncbi:MAG TPA: hypothetical protein VEC60_05720, partial [Reyranella sp.]|nr:hypothetical protein [Reyranella sp.]
SGPILGAQHRAPEFDPEVEILSPASNNVVLKSPFDLRLRFKTYNGTRLDTASIKVLYLRNPQADLTPRVVKHLKGNMIEMSGAEAPPGQHEIRIEFKDSRNHVGSATLTLNVMK